MTVARCRSQPSRPASAGWWRWGAPRDGGQRSRLDRVKFRVVRPRPGGLVDGPRRHGCGHRCGVVCRPAGERRPRTWAGWCFGGRLHPSDRAGQTAAGGACRWRLRSGRRVAGAILHRSSLVRATAPVWNGPAPPQPPRRQLPPSAIAGPRQIRGLWPEVIVQADQRGDHHHGPVVDRPLLRAGRYRAELRLDHARSPSQGQEVEPRSRAGRPPGRGRARCGA
jgi:hypothetical protein